MWRPAAICRQSPHVGAAPARLAPKAIHYVAIIQPLGLVVHVPRLGKWSLAHGRKIEDGEPPAPTDARHVAFLEDNTRVVWRERWTLDTFMERPRLLCLD